LYIEKTTAYKAFEEKTHDNQIFCCQFPKVYPISTQQFLTSGSMTTMVDKLNLGHFRYIYIYLVGLNRKGRKLIKLVIYFC